MSVQQGKGNIKAKSLDALIDKHDAKMRRLFLKVMNAHAGYQVSSRSEAELLAEIRQGIEESCDET